MQRVDDRVRSAANAMTFNMADRIAAVASDATGIGGPDTAQGQFAATDAARERVPDHIASDLIGVMATLPKTGIGWAAGKIGLPKLLGYGAEGAVQAGVSDYVRNTDVDSALGSAALGGAASFGGGMFGKLAGNTISRFAGKTLPGTSAYPLASNMLRAGGTIVRGGNNPYVRGAMALKTGLVAPLVGEAMRGTGRWLGGMEKVNPELGESMRNAFAKLMAARQRTQ
jgi:hypothetical protein